MFNDFPNLGSSYAASYEVYGTPPHSAHSTLEADWSNSDSNPRVGAALPNRISRNSPTSSDHAYSHGLRSSDNHPHASYNAYASPPYTPQDGSRHSSYHDSYGRAILSQRRGSDTMAYLPSSRRGSAHISPDRSSSSWNAGVSAREPPLAQGGHHGTHYGWPPHVDNQYLTYDPQWTNNSSPALSSDMSLLVPPVDFRLDAMSISPHLDQTSSSSNRHISPASSTSSPPSSRRGSVDHSVGAGIKSCSHCHATQTPLWRREPNTLRPLCNACGLYLQQRHKHRPQELIDADAAEEESESEGEGEGPECSHCHTHHTSVWRRSKAGAQLCNACGVYSRLRGKDRPLALKRKKIKPRTKHTPPTPS